MMCHQLNDMGRSLVNAAFLVDNMAMCDHRVDASTKTIEYGG